MKRFARNVIVVSAFFIAFVLALKGSALFVSSATWQPTENLSIARVGASAALLPNGSILVTGGDPGTGPVASADIFNPDGTISAAVPMMYPRSKHISVTMSDGRVLVAGGMTVGGSTTSAAEIYDPVAKAWTPVALGMNEARSGATAVLLRDGRVLVAGGQNGTTISSTIEIFDPNLGAFTMLGMMSSPRSQHAMTLLNDGRVLIIGGSTGTTPVATTDIFDPVTGVVTSGPTLVTARFGHSATTLQNGAVVVIGGNNGNANPTQQDLTPAETVDFTQTTPTFMALATNLATPREGHTAILLPNNNSVLIIGGTSGGTAVASAELFTPQVSATGTWTYGFAATAAMSTARTALAGSANQVNAPSTTVQRNGIVAVAGGKDANGNLLNTTEAYGYPTVQTDQSDYPPGTTVTITGSGFQPNETVTIQLLESPLIDTHGPYIVQADANGNLVDQSFTTDEHDVDVRFFLTVTGGASGFIAQNTFTDNKNVTIAFAGSGSGNVTGKDNTTNTNGVLNCTDTSGTATGTCTFGAGNTDQLALTATPTTPSTIGSWSVPSGYTINSGCATGSTTCTFTLNNSTGTVTVTFNPGAVSATNSTIAANPTTVPANGTSTSTVTVTLKDSGGNPVSGKIVTLAAGGGSSTITTVNGTTGANGQATFTVTDTKVESVTYTAKDSADSITISQTATVTFTAGAVSATTSTVSPNPTAVTADGTSTSTITVTLLDANSNPVSGKAVSLAAGSGSSVITTVNGTTNASGQATFAVKDTKAEAVTYTGKDTTDAITLSETATVTFTAGAVSTTISTVSPNPASVTADGTSTSTITVTLLDANSNPVSGKAVSLAAGSGSSIITTVNGTTNASGQATFTVKDAVVETVIYTAKDTSDSITITQTATVNFGAGTVSTSGSTVSASPSSVTANGSSTSAITVTLFDSFSHPVSGKTVTLTAGSGNSTITTVNGTTNANGQAAFTVKDTKAENVTYIAKDTTDNITITQTATVTFTAGPVNGTTSTMSANPNSVTADGSTTSTITVTLLDANNNPVSGKSVTLSEGTGSSTISAPSGTSNSSGVVTFTVKDTKAETVTYSATDSTDAISITQTASVTFTPGPLAKFVFANISSPQIAGVTFGVTITAEDANGNTVTSFSQDGNQATLTSTGTLLGSPVTVTFTNGVASQNVSITNTGNFTLIATGNPGHASGITGTGNSFIVNPGPASSFTVSAPASATAGTIFNFTVTAKDAFDNPATGYTGTVKFTSTDAQAVLPSSSQLTNGIGNFSATLKTAGGQTITATDAANSSIAGTSNTITVSPSTAATFVIAAPPSATAGTSFNFTVTAKDGFGNIATGYTGTVKFASTDPQAVLPANSLLANGMGTFAATLKTAAAQTITATDTVNNSMTGTSGTITVSAGALDHIAIAPASAAITAGGSQPYTASAFDAFGNSLGDVTSSTAFTMTNGSCTANLCSGTVAGSQAVTGTYNGKTATASLTVNPGAITHLLLSPVTANITAGQSQNYTAEGLDAFNNPTGDVTIATTFSISPDGSCMSGGDPASCTTAVADVSGSSHTVTGIYTSGAQGTATLTVNPASPTQLAITSKAFTVIAGQCSGTITVSSEDQYNNTSNVGSNTKVNLSSPSAEAKFYSDTACQIPITPDNEGKTSITISSGNSSQTFSYTDTTPSPASTSPAFTTTITAADDAKALTSGTQSETILTLTFTTPSFTVTQNSCSGQITLTAENASGTPTNITIGANVALTSTSVGETFYSDPACAMPITPTGTPAVYAVTIGNGSKVVNFSYEDSVAGNLTITANVGTYSVSQQEEIGTPPKVSTNPTNATITYGSNATFTAAASGSPAPTVQWQVSPDGNTWTNVTNGGAYNGATSTTLTLTVPPVSLSGTQYRAVFTNPVSSATTTAAVLTVNPEPLTITANSQAKNYGQASTFTGIEFATSGLVNGDTVASVTLISAGASATASVAGSPYNIIPSAAVFGGGSANNYAITYLNGTLTVSPVPLNITASSGSFAYGGTPPMISAMYYGFVNGENAGSLTSQPTCGTSATSASPVGSYVSSCWGGVDSNYLINYVTGVVTVMPAGTSTAVNSSANLSIYGTSVTFTAIVTNTATAAAPTGTVQFVIDGINFGSAVAVTPSGNTARATISTATLMAGSHTVTAQYLNIDGNFSASNGALTGGQTVNAATTSLGVTSSKNPSNYGDSITFTATVIDTSTGDTAVPTGGTVQFFVDGANFGSPVNLSSGTATSTSTTSLAAGQHVVTAVFSGDTDFTGSTSSFFIQTVKNPLVSIGVTPSNSTIVVGQTEQFTAKGTYADASSATVPAGALWTIANSMPNPVSAPVATAGSNGLLYFFGGQDASGAENFVQTYNPSTGVWGTASNTGFTARYAGLAVAPGDGKIYVIGGLTGTGTSATNVVEAYDPTADAWSSKTSMPNANGCLVGGAINGQIYVLSGCSSSSTYTKRLDVFSSATNTWNNSPLASPTSGHGSGATGVINGKLYVAGGYDTTGTITGATEAYDPQTNTWASMTAMTTPLAQVGSATVNGKLYVGGGVDGGNNEQSAVSVYDPSNDPGTPWSAVFASLSEGRTNIGLVPFDTLLYAAGGSGSSPTGLLEVVDTDDVIWSSDNSTIAAIMANSGLATGVNAGGSANILATSMGYSITGGTSLTVNKADTTTTITANTPNPSVVNQAVTISVTVSVNAPGAGTPTGTVAVSDGVGETCTVILSGAGGSCMLAPQAAGTDTLTATYTGDSNFNASATSAGVSQTVNTRRTTTTISLSPASVFVNQASTATVTVEDTEANGSVLSPTGVVVVTSDSGDTIAGTCALMSSSTGVSTCSVTVTPNNLATGTHNVTATFSATAVHSASNGSNALAVKLRTTTTAVTLNPNSVFVDQLTSATVMVTDSAGSGTVEYPTGSISLTTGDATDTNTSPCTLANTATAGVSSCTVTITPTMFDGGSRTVKATFMATSIHAASSDAGEALTVTLRPTTVGIVVVSPVVVGQATTVAVSVGDAGSAGMASIPAGIVSFSTSGHGVFSAASCTLSAAGTCSVSYTPADTLGSPQTVSGSFAPNDNVHSASNNSGQNDGNNKLTVNRATTQTAITITSPISYGQSTMVNATITPQFPGTPPTGTVIVSDGIGNAAGDSCAITLGNGNGAAIGSCLLTPSAAATSEATVTGTYSGDVNFVGSAGMTTLTVNKASTSTVVISSNPSTTFMEAVTLTATVSGTPIGTPNPPNTNANDTVQFSYSTSGPNGPWTNIGPVTQLTAGQASLTTSSLPGNTTFIQVTFSGDANFLASAGATAQTVTPAPVLTVSPSSIAFGNVNVNSKSSPYTITLTNNGDATLNFDSTGISIVGTYGNEFQIKSNTCGTSISQGGGNCVITLDFAPADTGTANATLQICDNDNNLTIGGSQNCGGYAEQDVALSGGGLTTLTSGSFYPYAMFATQNACGSISMSGSSTVDSFSSIEGFGASHQLNGGNVGANGNLTLSGNATIYGSAAVDYTTTGNCNKNSITGVTTNGGAKVTAGNVALNGPISYPSPAAPNPAPPTAKQNITSCPSGMIGCTNMGIKAVTLAPGSYGNVQVSGGTTVNLSTGTYNFNSLAFGGNSILYVSSGPIIINLAGAGVTGGNPALDFSGGSIVNPTSIPITLQFTYGGTQGINLSGGSQAYATVYAPNAPINMSGGTDFFGAIVGSTITNSGGTAMHYDSVLAGIEPGPSSQNGNYIWFSAAVNNVKGLSSNQTKLYLTNSSITYTVPNGPNAGTYNVPVPNAVVTFNAASGSFGTSYSLTDSRWNTSVPSTDLTGNTFVAGVAIPVPTGGFPSGIQNVTWTAAFSTDEPNISFQWAWNAGVYNSGFAGGTCLAGSAGTVCPTSTYASPINNQNNLLGVNQEDGAADPDGTDPAGTPENYKQDEVIGFFSASGGVVPTTAEMSTTPSSYSFGTLTLTASSGPTAVAVLSNNDTVTHNISSIAISVATDFILASGPNGCATGAFGMGSSCTLYVNFTANYTGTESAKIGIKDDANNSPQTVYLTGAGH